MFQIVYSKKALKFLKKQDIPTRKRIVAAIDRLPAEGDIKKLQGVNGSVSYTHLTLPTNSRV